MKDSFVQRYIKEEKASASIVEYTIVLPICLLVIGFLFVAAYFMNERALLDAAVERGVLDAQKIFADPNSSDVMDFSPGGYEKPGYSVKKKINWANIESDPYRFLNNKYNYGKLSQKVTDKIKKTVEDCGLANDGEWFDNAKIECSKVEGFLSKSITVTVRQKFDMPFIPLIMKDSSLFDVEITSSASMPIVCPTEFLRNVDFVSDTIERYTEVNIADKIKGFFDKITNFFDNTTKK